MIGTDGDGRRWSIGELARASGLTVRALRHYDDVGLLRASERAGSGHRRYTEEDVRRLYRLRALRSLGLSLSKIASVLDGTPDDVAAMQGLLSEKLRGLERHERRIQRLKHQVNDLLRQFDGSSMPDSDQFMTTLEMMSVFETYFTEEQRTLLAERREMLGTEAIEEAKARWAGLVEELLAHMRAGTPVDSPHVRDLAGRWDALARPFHGGDEQVKAATQRMWQDNSAEIGGRLPWPVEQMRDLVDYLNRARQA